MRRTPLLFAVAALVVGAVAVVSAPARGDGPSDREALVVAVKRGQDLWNQSWAPNQKSCGTCHNAGPNKLIAARLKSYPKFDKSLGKVVTGQQKMNDMIKTKAMGTPLELGSDDLNALEAYVSTLR